jgi:hypothetical protein
MAFRHRDGGVFYDRPGMMKQWWIPGNIGKPIGKWRFTLW